MVGNITQGDIDRIRTRIEESDELSEADRKSLIAFSDQLALLQTDYSHSRHLKLLQHCFMIGRKVGGLAEALTNKDAAEEIVRWINATYENEETNRDYRVAVRVFGKRLAENDTIPESIDWISANTSRNYKPKPDPTEMLHWEKDVLPMINEARNSRDAAMIAVAWDSGARSGEFRNLQIGDVTDHDHGLQISVDGKTGQRSITLIPSVPYLNRWLSDHPASNDGNAPLWSKLQEPDDLSFQMFKKAFEKAANAAGVTKPVNITNFRKSSASHLANQGVNQTHIEDHHGWTRGSTAASRYITVFGKDSDRELAKVYGVEFEESEPEPIGPICCPRCQRDTPRNEDFCVWCNQALDQEAVREVKGREREVRDAIFRLVQEDPGILTERERISDLITLVDEVPHLFDDAERFVAALEDT